MAGPDHVNEAMGAEGPETHLSTSIACHNQGQRAKVQRGKDDLGREDVMASVRQEVQASIDVHMGSRVDQGTCPASDLGVVAFPRDVLLHLLHIGLPINFGIYEDAMALQNAEHEEMRPAYRAPCGRSGRRVARRPPVGAVTAMRDSWDPAQHR